MARGIAVGIGSTGGGGGFGAPVLDDPVSIWFEPDFRADVATMEEAEQLLESLQATFAEFGISIKTTPKPPPEA